MGGPRWNHRAMQSDFDAGLESAAAQRIYKNSGNLLGELTRHKDTDATGSAQRAGQHRSIVQRRHIAQ